MKYIHQLEDWPKFKWDSDRLAPLLADVRHRQGRLLGQMESHGFQLRGEANLLTITADIVKSSAIEGEQLDSEQVRSSIARHLGMDIGGTPHIARHIDGLVEMMLDATMNHTAALTAERLFGWHATLFPTGRSGMRDITVGAWRPVEAGPMRVVSGPMGREKVHFEAPEADRLPDEMNAFLDWFNAASGTDPVLKAAVAHFWFVTIHPFEDGNGRIARAIADLSLARADGTSERYYSMSAQIEAERNQYYDSLKKCQCGSLDITRWLVWFLECLDRSIDGAQETLAAVLRKARIWGGINKVPVNERQRTVINRLLGDFEGHLALRDIRELLNRRILIQNPGAGRSTSYRLAEPEESNSKH